MKPLFYPSFYIYFFILIRLFYHCWLTNLYISNSIKHICMLHVIPHFNKGWNNVDKFCFYGQWLISFIVILMSSFVTFHLPLHTHTYSIIYTHVHTHVLHTHTHTKMDSSYTWCNWKELYFFYNIRFREMLCLQQFHNKF